MQRQHRPKMLSVRDCYCENIRHSLSKMTSADADMLGDNLNLLYQSVPDLNQLGA